QVEVLGDLLYKQGAFGEAAFTYAAARKLAKDRELDPTKYENERAAAQARAVSKKAAAQTTRGQGQARRRWPRAARATCGRRPCTGRPRRGPRTRRSWGYSRPRRR